MAKDGNCAPMPGVCCGPDAGCWSPPKAGPERAGTPRTWARPWRGWCVLARSSRHWRVLHSRHLRRRPRRSRRRWPPPCMRRTRPCAATMGRMRRRLSRNWPRRYWCWPARPALRPPADRICIWPAPQTRRSRLAATLPSVRAAAFLPACARVFGCSCRRPGCAWWRLPGTLICARYRTAFICWPN